MGSEHHRYYKHTKFHQNLRGDLKFLVDLTWNDPFMSCQQLALHRVHGQNLLFVQRFVL